MQEGLCVCVCVGGGQVSDAGGLIRGRSLELQTLQPAGAKHIKGGYGRCGFE
jgi:hypothetical protein